MGWAMTPSGMRGVLNDALSIYFTDATLASAFVSKWCLGAKIETAGGVFEVRGDEPEPRVESGAAPDALGASTVSAAPSAAARDEKPLLNRYRLGADARGRP
jgi:hypothetical protein